MKTLLLAGSAVAAILAAGVALAQAPSPPMAHEMPMRDAMPHTRADMQAHVQRMFARFDINHDGFITREEIASARKVGAKMHGQAMQGMQHDWRATAFDRIDTNHDGMISREEFAAAPHGSPGMHMKGMAMHRMGGMMAAMFDMADTNKDGRVSMAEAQALAMRHFDQADLNHDGVLSPDEQRQMHAKMREHHPG